MNNCNSLGKLNFFCRFTRIIESVNCRKLNAKHNNYSVVVLVVIAMKNKSWVYIMLLMKLNFSCCCQFLMMLDVF